LVLRLNLGVYGTTTVTRKLSVSLCVFFVRPSMGSLVLLASAWFLSFNI
jgi:hypothetical protein